MLGTGVTLVDKMRNAWDGGHLNRQAAIDLMIRMSEASDFCRFGILKIESVKIRISEESKI